MRIIATFFLLPLLTAAFTPQQPVVRSALFQRDAALVTEPAALNEFNGGVTSKVESALGLADDLVLKRLMRFVNHAPVVVTLGNLLNQLGSAKYGLDIAPSALSIASPAGLAIPQWIGYSLRVAAVAQMAAVLRSSLAEDSDELSQGDISSIAVSNVALGRALADGSPINWAIAAVASGFSARNGGDEEASLTNLSTQVTTAITSVAAVMGLATTLPSVVPLLQGQEQVTALLGLGGFLALSDRDGNNTVKKVVAACVSGGMLVSKIAGGALNVGNLLRLDTVVTAGVAYVAAFSIDQARQALMD